jgi:hypothetical protein
MLATRTVLVFAFAAAAIAPATGTATPERSAAAPSMHGRESVVRHDHDATWRRHLRFAVTIPQSDCGAEWVGGPC